MTIGGIGRKEMKVIAHTLQELGLLPPINMVEFVRLSNAQMRNRLHAVIREQIRVVRQR